MGSDHDVYEEGAFRIPAIYMNDYPDRYIHTDGDVAANIDPTKLKRAGFIGAASGYFLAQMGAKDAADIVHLVERASLRRTQENLQLQDEMQKAGSPELIRSQVIYEIGVFSSISQFAVVENDLKRESDQFSDRRLEPLARDHIPAIGLSLSEGKEVSNAFGSAKGPMAVFGYDYLTDHYGAERAAKLALFSYRGLRGSGSEYAYEVLNFVNGKNPVARITSLVSSEYGTIPMEMVSGIS